VFKQLTDVYPNSYILEVKMSICAINMGLYRESIEHSIRALELNQRLAQEESVMDVLAYAYEMLGDTESSKRISEYYFGFAANQTKYS
jgi:hypothetical protein